MYDEPSDFERQLDQDLRNLIFQYLGASEASAWDESRSPYPGLRAFNPEESLIFYGRGREIDELFVKLSDSKCRFIAVVGASGSGKSSLIAAGLLPALNKNAIYGSKDWVWGRFTPGELGDNPFVAMASAFKEIIEAHRLRPGDIARSLKNDPLFLTELVTMALKHKARWAELLLFIDQFEEIFSLVDPNHLSAFVNLLELAAKTERVRTVITLRDDFFHRCNQRPGLNALLKDGQYNLLAPNLEQLKEMITRPAERAGLRFEEGLVQRILDDTGLEPGALALMAYALSQLWEATKGHGRIMTHAAYNSFNGVHGAIGRRAEDTFQCFECTTKNVEDRFTRVFRELVEVDEQGVASRRRAKLGAVTTEREAETIVNALIKDRLLVTGREKEGEPTVEVAHEAIFTSWKRLREWIEVKRDDLRLLRQVRLAAAEWKEKSRAEYLRWPHERLSLVSQMLERLQPNLSELESEFIRPESERLLEEIDKTATTHQQRVRIGERLAEIGDPRSGVGLRKDGLPDIVWCKVPKGKITLVKKKGTFRVDVDAFHIAKYPVTYIQYRSFIAAEDGYRKKGWWKELAEREDQPGEQFRKFDNHPAENVSWYDAMAFCRWLTEKLGYEVRLPTEWEWQQAATGGDPANEYPWGPEWDSSKANTSESGLSRTTAVGMYPQGASPVGALDMSGNVREWCLNEYENPKRVEVSGEKSRALRGGGWSRGRVYARCAYLLWYYHPDLRYGYVGFRLVCASPIF